MAAVSSWYDGVPVAIIITDRQGNILDLNAHAREALAAYGGAELIGKDVLDCHPEPARSKTAELYRERLANHYTIQKSGTRKIIHQIPWFQNNEFAGYVEMSLLIPERLPHFDRSG